MLEDPKPWEEYGGGEPTATAVAEGPWTDFAAEKQIDIEDLSKPAPGERVVFERPVTMDIRKTTGGGARNEFAPLAVQAMALGEEARGGWEHANTPLVEVMHQDAAGPWNEFAGAPVDAGDAKVQQLAKGAGKSVADSVNWFASPLGIATLGTGALPRMAQRAIALLFTTKMVSDAPEIAQGLGSEFGKAPADRDYERIGELTAAAVQDLGFAPLLGKHALSKAPVGAEIGRMISQDPLRGGTAPEGPGAKAAEVPIEFGVRPDPLRDAPVVSAQPELPLEAPVDALGGNTQVVETPLGVLRPAVRDANLARLDEKSFDDLYRTTQAELDKAETLYDQNPKAVDREKLGALQDKWTAVDLERFRRNSLEIVPEDLTRKLLDVVGPAARGDSESMHKADILIEELRRQGATEKEMLKDIRLASPDAVEVFRGKLEALRKVVTGPNVQTGKEVTHGMGGSTARGGAPAAVPAAGGAPVSRGFIPLPEAAKSILKDFEAVRGLTAPQSLGESARFAGNLLRELNAKLANRTARADELLSEHRRSFDSTPVPADWRYVPGDPLPRNYAFIDAYEGGSAAGLGPREARAAGEFRQLNDQWLEQVRALGTGALRVVIENYFPHLWKDPEAARSVMGQILAKAPLEGSKNFLKQRTYRLFRDGLEAGLVPAHDNPVDLFLLKHREVQKFILGRTFVNEMRSAGLTKFVHVFNKEPEGWATVNDRAFTVYGPPTVTIKEAFDAGMRAKTIEVLERMGVPHERLARMRGKMWGLAQYVEGVPGTERIKSRFGGPPDVIWHELGHAIDNRYTALRPRLFDGKVKQDELRALADLRFEGETPAPSYKRYVRSTEEKMAVTLQAYLHAPERMRSVAPAIMGELRKFIAEHPEMSGIEDIRPSLKLGVGQAELSHGGLLKLGQWYMPAEAAKVVNNYLSPGLQRFGTYNTLRQTSNILNAAQLGLSAFHLGFTSLDAAVSRLAVGFEDLARGKVLRGLGTIASTPAAPFTNIYRGAKLKAAVMERPGATGIPELEQMVRALESAGGRVGQDAFWQTQFSRKMMRAFHQGTATGYIKGAVAAPFALLEQTMRPIMEYVVPRQKLGVFVDMARRELERVGPDADPAVVREAMRKAWDSVDNRMGQVVYDNLFYNRVVKDLALLSFRAYGWQLGKYRELGGAALDVASQVKALAQGKRPELTHRMAYALALPILVGTMGALTQYLMTGKGPTDWRDYFMPRTGEKDENGREVRISLPSYMKDVIAISKHPVRSVGHSANPAIGVVADMLQNRDYYDTRIFNPDDPMVQKLKDTGMYLGKEFTPFSVQGARKLAEDSPPLWKQVMPFFGVVPTPKSVTMSPAEQLAAESIADRMPAGSRTKEQFDRSKLIREIVAGTKSGAPWRGIEAQGKYRDGITNGMLKPNVASTMIERLKYTPLQFQVAQMDSEGAMRVWRIASPEERKQLVAIIGTKITSSKAVPKDLKAKWVAELQAGQPK